MNPRLTFTTTGRVLRQIAHDPRTVAMLLLVPAILLGLLAWVFTDTKNFDTVGPALLGLFPFIVMFLVTSITTLRERRSGTLERLLTMPIHKLDIVSGYAIAFGLVAIVQATLCSILSVTVYGMTLDGELWQLLIVAVLDALLGTALGLCASAFASTEFQVVQFMPVFIFPQILLGGFLIPRDQMPDALHILSDWLPLSHAVDSLNRVSAGKPFGDSAADLWIIAAWVVGSIVLASISLRRRTP